MVHGSHAGAEACQRTPGGDSLPFLWGWNRLLRKLLYVMQGLNALLENLMKRPAETRDLTADYPIREKNEYQLLALRPGPPPRPLGRE